MLKNYTFSLFLVTICLSFIGCEKDPNIILSDSNSYKAFYPLGTSFSGSQNEYSLNLIAPQACNSFYYESNLDDKDDFGFMSSSSRSCFVINGYGNPDNALVALKNRNCALATFTNPLSTNGFGALTMDISASCYGCDFESTLDYLTLVIINFDTREQKLFRFENDISQNSWNYTEDATFTINFSDLPDQGMSMTNTIPFNPLSPTKISKLEIINVPPGSISISLDMTQSKDLSEVWAVDNLVLRCLDR